MYTYILMMYPIHKSINQYINKLPGPRSTESALITQLGNYSIESAHLKPSPPKALIIKVMKEPRS